MKLSNGYMHRKKRLPLRIEHQKEISSPFFKYRLVLRNLNVRQCTNRLLWVSIAIFFLAGPLMMISKEGSPARIFAFSLVFCALFILGIIGFLWFYRKEMYYKGSISKGNWARINGFFLMLSGWGLILIFLFFGGK